MANSYYDGTGVLVFSGEPKVTPMIHALFGAWELDVSEPGGSEVYIANIAETTSTHWDTILGSLQTELNGPQHDFGVEDPDDIESWLTALGEHFNVEKEVLEAFIEDTDFDEDAELEDLFTLAAWFNDGHNLHSIKWQGAFHSDKARLFNFGGDAAVIGHSGSFFAYTGRLMGFYAELEAATRADDLRPAAQLLAHHVRGLIESTFDRTTQDKLRELVVEAMKADPHEA